MLRQGSLQHRPRKWDATLTRRASPADLISTLRALPFALETPHSSHTPRRYRESATYRGLDAHDDDETFDNPDFLGEFSCFPTFPTFL